MGLRARSLDDEGSVAVSLAPVNLRERRAVKGRKCEFSPPLHGRMLNINNNDLLPTVGIEWKAMRNLD